MRRYCILLVIFLCARMLSASRTDSLAIAIGEQLGVTIAYAEVVPSIWTEVNYQPCTDSMALYKYLLVLQKEYAKYPKGYFKAAGVHTIALGLQLRFDAQNRAAIPDPYKNVLYLSIEGSSAYATPLYLVHVMHHELHHCAEYMLWKDMYYKWRTWKKTNRCFFKYGPGGEKAYHQRSVNWGGLTHPKKGFVNLYATMGQEEDRSEIVALLMTDEEYGYLKKFMKTDRFLRRKVKLMIETLNTLSGTTDAYWTRH